MVIRWRAIGGDPSGGGSREAIRWSASGGRGGGRGAAALPGCAAAGERGASGGKWRRSRGDHPTRLRNRAA
jgi:hypothetical protein